MQNIVAPPAIRMNTNAVIEATINAHGNRHAMFSVLPYFIVFDLSPESRTTVRDRDCLQMFVFWFADWGVLTEARQHRFQ